MRKLENLQDLFYQQLEEHYSAEQMQLKEWALLVNHATAPWLKHLIDRQVKSTVVQLDRLNVIAEKVESNFSGKNNDAVEAMLEKCWDITGQTTDPSVIDMVLYTSLEQLIHYQVASYASSLWLARQLDREIAITYLQLNFEEIMNAKTAAKNAAKPLTTTAVTPQ